MTSSQALIMNFDSFARCIRVNANCEFNNLDNFWWIRDTVNWLEFQQIDTETAPI